MQRGETWRQGELDRAHHTCLPSEPAAHLAATKASFAQASKTRQQREVGLPQASGLVHPSPCLDSAALIGVVGADGKPHVSSPAGLVAVALS